VNIFRFCRLLNFIRAFDFAGSFWGIGNVTDTIPVYWAQAFPERPVPTALDLIIVRWALRRMDANFNLWCQGASS
jgi:hypothetical protein